MSCYICFVKCSNLVNTLDTDVENLKWSSKLAFCIPEMDCCDDQLLCGLCIQQLETTWIFRKLCLQSKDQREQLQLNETVQKEPWYDPPSGLHETTNYDLVKEEEVDSKQGTFSCFYCNELLIDRTSLINHITTHHNEKTNTKKCHLCAKPCSNQRALLNHLYEQHNEETDTSKRYECDKCLQLFDALELKLHIENCQNLPPPTELLPKEEVQIPKQGEKKRRGRKKSEELSELSKVCHICGVLFTSRYMATRHMRNVHATEKKFQCEICNQKFVSSVYLNAHKRYHSRERPNICAFCGKGFITGSDLYHHEKIHANKREYKCEKCPKAFNTSSDLFKHRLCVHQDRSNWKYLCTFCDRRFPLKTNLDAHIKTHTGERNFACHLCDRKCVNRSVLLRHINSHSNVRLFKCHVCNGEYKYEKSLNLHLTKVHGIGDAKIPIRTKKFFCHICPKSYIANNKLQKHIRTHTGERPFACEMCDKRFIDKSYIKQHLKTAHNVVMDNTN